MRIKKFIETKYSKCFFAGKIKKPLKIGIYQDLLATREIDTELSARNIKYFLALYCTDPSYIEALKQPGAMRVNLAGEEIAAVSEEDRQRAVQSPRRATWKEEQVSKNLEKLADKKSSKSVSVTSLDAINKPENKVVIKKIVNTAAKKGKKSKTKQGPVIIYKKNKRTR